MVIVSAEFQLAARVRIRKTRCRAKARGTDFAHGRVQDLQRHVEPLCVHVSHYEVYNEQIYDLLAEDGLPSAPGAQRPCLRLKEDSLGRVFVGALSEVRAASPLATTPMSSSSCTTAD